MSEALEFHPAAGLFPMMGDEELTALVEDIKANGLRQPIVLDGEGRVLDGRNRLKACRLAGVEPQFTSTNGADPVALSLSLNLQRRNLTASQRAIVAAAAWDLFEAKRGRPEKEYQNGTPEKTSERLARAFGVSRSFVEQARALLRDDSAGAEEVKNGVRPLREAYEEMRGRQTRDYLVRKQRDELRASYTDLFESVEAGTLTLQDARSEAAERDERLRTSRWSATVNLLDGLLFLRQPSNPEHISRTLALFDPQVAAQRHQCLTAEGLRECAAFAAALADAIDANPGNYGDPPRFTVLAGGRRSRKG